MLPFWLIVVIWLSKHAGLIYGNLLVPWDEKGATFALLVSPSCFGAQLAEGSAANTDGWVLYLRGLRWGVVFTTFTIASGLPPGFT